VKNACLVVLVCALLWAGLAVVLPGGVSATPFTPWPFPEGDELGRDLSPAVYGPRSLPYQVWSYTPPNCAKAGNVVVAQDGSLYLLYRKNTGTSDGYPRICLDKLSKDGSRLWTVEVSQRSAFMDDSIDFGGPVMFDDGSVGVVYIIREYYSHFNDYYYFAYFKRISPDGSVLWTYKDPNYMYYTMSNWNLKLVRDVSNSARVYYVYNYTLVNPCSYWRCLDISTCQRVWDKVESGYWRNGVASPGGGLIYFTEAGTLAKSSSWSKTIGDAHLYLAGPEGLVYTGGAQLISAHRSSDGTCVATFGGSGGPAITSTSDLAQGPDGSLYRLGYASEGGQYQLYLQRFGPAPGYTLQWSVALGLGSPTSRDRVIVDAGGNAFVKQGSASKLHGVSSGGQVLWALNTTAELLGMGGDGRLYCNSGTTYLAYNSQVGLPPPTNLTAVSGGLDWHPSAGRGYVLLSYSVPSATAYRVHVFDGYAYRAFDVGSATTWDSRVARVYPSEEQLASYADNTVTSDIFNHVQGGLDLRDDPRGLYRKTAGTTCDSCTNYWFRVSAWNPWCSEGPMSNAVMPTLPNRTDPVPPSGSLTINDGATVTASVNVTLQLSASDSGGSGLQSMRFSNDGAVWSPWYPYAPTYSGWSISPGEGTKTVYAEFRDGAGNVSPRAAAQIYLRFDLIPPEAELKINGGAEVVSSTAVTLTLIASDNATPTANLKVRYSNDGQSWTPWESFAPTRAWTLPAGEGPKVVYVQVKDENGSITTAYALTNLALTGSGVVSAASGPGGGPVTVPAAAAARLGVPSSARLLSGSYALVSLTPPAGVSDMRFSFDGVEWQPPEPLQASRGVFLPPGDGPRVVWVQFGSKLPVSQVFVVDTQAPRLDVRWLGDAAATSGGQATLVLEVQDNLFLPSELQMSTDGGATWVAFQPQVTLSFSGTGYKVVRVGVRDPALNTAWKTLQVYNP